MSDLVVLDFDGVGTADEVLTKLRGLQKEHLIDLEDACVVVYTENGKVQIKQALNLTGASRRFANAALNIHPCIRTAIYWPAVARLVASTADTSTARSAAIGFAAAIPRRDEALQDANLLNVAAECQGGNHSRSTSTAIQP